MIGVAREFVRLCVANDTKNAFELIKDLKVVDFVPALEQVAEEQPQHQAFIDAVSRHLIETLWEPAV